MTEFQNFLQNIAEALRSLAAVVENLGEAAMQPPAEQKSTPQEAAPKEPTKPKAAPQEQPESESPEEMEAEEPAEKEESLQAKEAPKARRAENEPRRRKIIRPGGKPATAAETVYQVIKSKKGGIDTSDLMDETKFDEKKVRNIIYKLKKQDKIKTAKRGVYVAS